MDKIVDYVLSSTYMKTVEQREPSHLYLFQDEVGCIVEHLKDEGSYILLQLDPVKGTFC